MPYQLKYFDNFTGEYFGKLYVQAAEDVYK